MWFKVGGATQGKVTGFDSKQKILTLGGNPIKLDRISTVIFDRKTLYRSDGTIVIRGEDTAKAKQSIWKNLPLSALRLKDPKLGQGEVNLTGSMKPKALTGFQSVAVKSVYVVDELQFQLVDKVTIKVTPADPP